MTASYQGATEKKKVCETELLRYQGFYRHLVSNVAVLKKRFLAAVQAKYVFVKYQRVHLAQEEVRQNDKVATITHKKRQLREQESANPTLAQKRARISAAASGADVAGEPKLPDPMQAMDLGI